MKRKNIYKIKLQLLVSTIHLMVFVVIQAIPFRYWSALLIRLEKMRTMHDNQSVLPLPDKTIDRIISSSFLKQSNCLEKALMKKIYLVYKGVPSTLCLGIMHEENRLIAHAWLLCDHEQYRAEMISDGFIQVYPSSLRTSG